MVLFGDKCIYLLNSYWTDKTVVTDRQTDAVTPMAARPRCKNLINHNLNYLTE